MAAAKVTLETLRRNKEEGRPSAGVSCYTAPDAALAEAAGVDFIVVGDSLAMTLLGFKSTLPATMAEMCLFTTAVWRGMADKRPLIVADMPLGSYQPAERDAVINACELIRHGADVVKLEGCMPTRISALVDSGIGVVAHLGLQPQMKAITGGWRIQGKTAAAAQSIRDQARRVEDAGAHVLLLEAMPREAASFVRESVEMPVFGIGCGPDLDGQLLVLADICGLFFQFKSRFAKRYVEAGELIAQGMKQYVHDVQTRSFPTVEHCYPMDPGEVAGLRTAKPEDEPE